MTPFKSETEFLQWKETNQWLWDLLGKYQDQLGQQVNHLGQSMVVCKDEEVSDIRLRAIKIQGGGEALAQLIDLDFATIEKTFQ